MAVSILVKQCSVPSYVAYYGHLENGKSSPPTVLCESTYSILKFSGILQLKKVGATCNKPRLDSHWALSKIQMNHIMDEYNL